MNRVPGALHSGEWHCAVLPCARRGSSRVVAADAPFNEMPAEGRIVAAELLEPLIARCAKPHRLADQQALRRPLVEGLAPDGNRVDAVGARRGYRLAAHQ